MTMERLTAQLCAIGLSISKRQVMRLLIDRQDSFLTESRDVLRAGLQTAAWITVDDTGARHAGSRRDENSKTISFGSPAGATGSAGSRRSGLWDCSSGEKPVQPSGSHYFAGSVRRRAGLFAWAGS